MAQSQVQSQTQEQALRQTATVTMQQMLQAELVGLPLHQLVDRINAEMDDNPALEATPPADDARAADDYGHGEADDDSHADDDYAATSEREERQSALDEALAGIGRDDEELPVYHGGEPVAERAEMAYGDMASFYDQLMEQVGELELTERERDIMDYVVCSLDDDGLLRKTEDAMADEMAIYQGIDATAEEVARAVERLQQLDPAGIGARSLQECLLLQIARRKPSRMRALMKSVVSDHFDEFTKKHWAQLKVLLGLDETEAGTLFAELRKLNPKPGAAMGEAVGRSVEQITPDFIVDTHDDGTVTMQLNMGDVPELRVSQSFADIMRQYQAGRATMSRQAKEALLYTKRKVDAAHGFIEAVKTRCRTLNAVMQAIIHWQRRFFEEGDEQLLRPMILKDIAGRTGLAISTVSRVCSGKYVQTRWGTFPLRHFFSDGIVTGSGEELSIHRIKAALRDLVAEEDKAHPLSDDAIRDELTRRGFPIARRTVAKYREMLGIPIARLRK